ncbi:hypothetical protein N665_0809s0007 [Sinapis alba]|nr:hypothetical protein N665_0809s0007 [Sinapis alba]
MRKIITPNKRLEDNSSYTFCSSLCTHFLQNTRNMKLFLFLSFSALMLLEAFGNSQETDKQALLKFKSQVSEEKKVLLSSWNNSFPLCRWTGVTCGRKHKRVTGLDLGEFQLGGVISPSIGDDLTAHVSDFGLARILLKFDQETFINQLSSAGVRGSIGYAAPEYAMGGEISVHGDAYSFGILILEMFSGKRPTDEMFGGDITLRSCIRSALPEQVLDVADESVLHNGLRIGFPVAECLTRVLEVGLRCSEESPANRLGMSEVVKELISIKERFFKARRGARR